MAEREHPTASPSPSDRSPEDVIAKVLRVHSGEDFGAADFPTLEDGQAAVAALSLLVARAEKAEAERDSKAAIAEAEGRCRVRAEEELAHCRKALRFIVREGTEHPTRVRAYLVNIARAALGGQ